MMRGRVLGLCLTLTAINFVVWGLALLAFWSHPILLGTALLAYMFGLRHAVDADHICAIDNVTRRLMQDGQRPVGVGFFFSLGHSTVVVALSIVVAAAAAVVRDHLPSLQRAGAVVGTSVSAAFLLLIASFNLIVLIEIFKMFARVRHGESVADQSVDSMLDRRGLIALFFRPVLRIVDRSWKMYPIGLLFGLGFDTATEVALLAMAAVEAGKGLPVHDILLFPLLFTAGMSLIDTTDGILMLGAYGWAFVRPMRKLYYNMVITLVSVLVAVIIGGIEVASLIADQLRLSGGIWDTATELNANFGTVGFVIVGIFLVSWALSTAIYKLRRYDDLDTEGGGGLGLSA